MKTVGSEEGIERLVAVLQQDGEARTRELAELNTQLEERNRLLERQLGNKAATAKVLAVLGLLLAVMVGVWVYLLMQQMSGDIDKMASRIGLMQTYMKNMGGGRLNKGETGFMSSIARNTDSMAEDMGAMREAMQQVSGDIGSMRLAMEQTRGDIGTMNQAMGGMGKDMKLVSDNIATMAGSVGNMNRSVGRMSRDAQYMRDPMRAFDSVMPWN